MLTVRAAHTFVAEHGDELEFQAGEEIQVIEKDDAFGDGWWRVRGIRRRLDADYCLGPQCQRRGGSLSSNLYRGRRTANCARQRRARAPSGPPTQHRQRDERFTSRPRNSRRSRADTFDYDSTSPII